MQFFIQRLTHEPCSAQLILTDNWYFLTSGPGDRKRPCEVEAAEDEMDESDALLQIDPEKDCSGFPEVEKDMAPSAVIPAAKVCG